MRPRGEKHHKAKLTEHDVRLIQQLHPELSTRVIAEKFEVSQSTIAKILTAENWKHA